MFAMKFRRQLWLLFACALLASPLSALAEEKAWVTALQCLGPHINPKSCGAWPFQTLAHGVGGLFTEPTSLYIQEYLPYEQRTAYSIGQMMLEDDIHSKAIEFGWVVAPRIYHDDRPHLFIALRKPPRTDIACFIVPPGKPNPSPDYPPCPDNIWSGRLSEHFQPGDPVGATGVPMMYHVGYYAGNKAWWIQYGGEWIAWVSESWWDNGFRQGNHLEWYGEVTYTGDSCIPMGNGLYGTNPAAASVSNMFYEVMEGSTSIVRNAEAEILPETDADGWNANTESKNRKINRFRYGGPGRYCAL